MLRASLLDFQQLIRENSEENKRKKKFGPLCLVLVWSSSALEHKAFQSDKDVDYWKIEMHVS
jgi:hypothetical protein